MANVSGASLTPVLQRLNTVGGYHPFDANTFSDWSVEAGDKITVKREDASYSSPVHSTKMVWRGSPNLTISSTGQKERESVSKTGKKKYSRGTGGMRSQQGFRHDLFDADGYLRGVMELSESHLRTEFQSADNAIRSVVEQTESYLRASLDDAVNSMHSVVEQTASYWRAALDDTANDLHSTVEQTASYWRSALSAAESTLHSEVEQTASSWRASIEGIVDSTGRATAASIAVAINAAGEGVATINADKVYIGDEKSTTVISGKASLSDVSADYIAAKIETLSNLLATKITVGEVEATDVYIKPVYGMGKLNVSAGYSGSNLTLNGNTYTLRLVKFNGQYDDWSFSRATTLSGTWSGRNYVVTASPQGDIKTGTVYASAGNVVIPDTQDSVEYYATGNNHFVRRKHYVYSEDETSGDADSVIWHDYVTIDANGAYNAGYTDGSASGGTTTLTNSWTGGTITVTASPQGETLSRTLQAGSITWNGTTASVPISSVYGNSGQYSEGVVFTPTVSVADKLQTKTISANGTYTPDSGKIGFSSVTVSVPATDAKARFGASGGQYYIEAYDNVSGNPIAGSSMNYQLALNNGYVQVQDMNGTLAGAQYQIPLETKTVTENGTITPSTGNVGFSSVVVNVPSYASAHVAGSWGTGNNANVWTVSKTTSGSANNVSMTVTAGVSALSYNSSTHKYTAYGYAYGDGVQKASSGGSVSGTEAYDGAWAAARAKCSLPVSQSTAQYITTYIPATTVGGQGSQTYYVTADDSYAYIRVGSTTGTYVARVSNGAYGNGQTAAGLSINGNGTNTVTRALSSSTKSVSITATAVISYNSTTHKYTATAQSKAGSTNMGSASATSGTEAYTAGKSDFVNLLATPTNELIWFGYTTTRGSKSSFISPSWPESGYRRYLYARFDESVGGTRHNITTNTWYVPEPWIFTASGEGSEHQGDLTGGSYICIGARYYNDSGSYVSTTNTKFTWRVPNGSSANMSNMSISNSQFVASGSEGGMPAATNLSTIASLLRNNTHGWVYFKCTLSGASGSKWYRIATAN